MSDPEAYDFTYDAAGACLPPTTIAGQTIRLRRPAELGHHDVPYQPVVLRHPYRADHSVEPYAMLPTGLPLQWPSVTPIPAPTFPTFTTSPSAFDSQQRAGLEPIIDSKGNGLPHIVISPADESELWSQGQAAGRGHGRAPQRKKQRGKRRLKKGSSRVPPADEEVLIANDAEVSNPYEIPGFLADGSSIPSRSATHPVNPYLPLSPPSLPPPANLGAVFELRGDQPDLERYVHNLDQYQSSLTRPPLGIRSGNAAVRAQLHGLLPVEDRLDPSGESRSWGSGFADPFPAIQMIQPSDRAQLRDLLRGFETGKGRPD